MHEMERKSKSTAGGLTDLKRRLVLSYTEGFSKGFSGISKFGDVRGVKGRLRKPSLRSRYGNNFGHEVTTASGSLEHAD